MPRENRKRGKKHKKKDEEVPDVQHAHAEHPPEYEEHAEAGPSWIVPARDNSAIDQNAPFGFVDAEVKAYFRTVDVQIREWQETRPEVEENEDVDPNEDRRLFFVAALQEMSGKEKQLATDPDCSAILERMVYSMDDFVRRVFMDRLTGSLEQLSKHRFASHVFQTLLTVAGETVSRESRGIFPPAPETGEDEGELRTQTQLTLDACEELLPALSSLVLDSFASHVVRALLVLLAPDVFSGVDDAGGGPKTGFAVRSKKSAAYKARQGNMKSVFTAQEDQGKIHSTRHAPKEYQKTALSIVHALREQLGDNEVRSLAANQVASPVLQMLLELEAAYDEADTPGSLMDRVLMGLITSIHEDPDAEVPESDYLMTLLRDPTASHVLETLVCRSPDRVFNILWKTYFASKLPRLAVHPVANFVVAKAFERLSADQLAAVIQEMQGVAGKIIKNARTGVLQALVNRTSALSTDAQALVELVLNAFELNPKQNKPVLVPCILGLKSSPQDYQTALASAKKEQNDDKHDEPLHKRRKTEDPLEPKVQGALLLQAMLQLPSPYNDTIINGIQALSIDELTEMAHHPISSRVLDGLLISPTVPFKAKRKFVMTFIGHYHVLVDDRIGSRVGDRCWASADPYLKEKIARSLIPHEHTLAGSFYGKFFARNLSIHVLQRDPERWKSMQAASRVAAASSSAPAAPSGALGQENGATGPAPARSPDKGAKADKRKGKKKAQDEIDALFDATLGKKVKKAELASVHQETKVQFEDEAGDDEGEPKSKSGFKSKSKSKHKEPGYADKKKRKDRGKEGEGDRDLTDVLGAIRSAPKEDKGPKKRKRGL